MDNYIDPWHEKMLVEKDKEERACAIHIYMAVNHAVPLLPLTNSKTQVTTESDGLMNNRFDDILTISDEAFMLVVMDNYIDPWHEKMLLEKDKEESKGMYKKYIYIWSKMMLYHCCHSQIQRHRLLHNPTGREEGLAVRQV
jgi:hypothetical protein